MPSRSTARPRRCTSPAWRSGSGQGDLLWTVPNTFVASANCARYCGADVDFVDIDPRHLESERAGADREARAAQARGQLPKVVVPVHFAGQPTEQEAIWELAQHYGFKVLEDASHAIGASRNGEPVGSCRWSDITVFSFHPVKIITTGEGGMALTNDASSGRTHGACCAATASRATRRRFDATPHEDCCRMRLAAWYYEQQMLGFNYRMTDIQAALGVKPAAAAGDLCRTPQRAGAAAMTRRCTDLPLQLPWHAAREPCPRFISTWSGSKPAQDAADASAGVRRTAAARESA